MKDTFLKQINQFNEIGTVNTVTPLITSHINDSYIVEASLGKFVLQRINNLVFKNVTLLTDNILLVAKHINSKKTSFVVPELIKSISGTYFCNDENGNYWRMYRFIEGETFASVIDPAIADESASIVGLFHTLLSDLDVTKLNNTIPRFHDMDFRMDNFYASIETDRLKRSMKCHNEISKLVNIAADVKPLHDQAKQGAFPLRITHNNTKISKILFNNNRKAIGLISLDTVMLGYIIYDFGDAIRTANTSVEDETDHSTVNINMDIYKAYAHGYIKSVEGIITTSERNALALSAKYMTFIMALRFITDYIDGDIYYKTNHEHHNLQRARAQIKLIESMNNNFAQMQEIIAKY